jgi:thiol:disulfide interchange protein DsbD|tara:strand:- start:394 stop:2340 length:1947 start_codon:yes stop_codon:yes gene_type:complete
MRFLSLFLIALTFAVDAKAVKTDHAEISIIGKNNIISEPGTIDLGYKFIFTPGWHTYWINPGDSGGPPNFQFNQIKGWKINQNLWPGPQTIEYPPLMTYGYENEVVFPFKLEIADLENKEADINIKFLVCDDICVPEEANLKLILKNKILNIEERPDELKKWTKLVPVRGPPDLKASIQNNQIKISADLIDRVSYFFPYDDQVTDFSAKQNFSDSTLSFAALDSFNGKVNGIISTESGFFEIDEQVSLQKSVQQSGISLLTAIIFALIGGLILNLMPCVLPVIALKALSLVKNANESRSSVTMNASAYVFGVILTFMIIASLLISFKNAGELIGWGYQLQSPFIVTLLCLLIFSIGLILVANIDIFSSAGKLERFNKGSGLVNSFLTGTLSVIVASPCTAPFMGAALGFALIQPDIYSYLVFLSLAVGFALPYFLIAIFPSLVNFLPKPGQWMESLKQLFGFMMFGAAIWLLWVLANQVDANSLLIVMVGLFLSGFILWLQKINFKHLIKTALILVFVYGYSLVNWDFKENVGTKDNDSVAWSLEREIDLRDGNKSYFINFTAAWCITCQVNEAVAFTDNVMEVFDNKDITYLKADWTNRNATIAKELEKYNRSGLPVYVYWNKNLDEPMVLNELLTEGYLMEIVNEN